ncbi:MAG: S9 family peptidase [Saprospiraceae bacterium]|jgi:dipeptidyl-peptidase-4|nr:S9 family peptidase [Saprospiraceae bacterium]
MMHRKLLVLLGLFVFQFLTAQLKEISLEDIYEKGSFPTKGIPGFKFMKDGQSYVRLQNSIITQYYLLSNDVKKVILDASQIENGLLKDKLESFEFSMDETKLLLKTESEGIYRYSSRAIYYVYDLESEKLQRIYSPNKIMYPAFNPKGDKVAFVFDNNLYYQDLKHESVKQITLDGKKNFIINGASDWVYEEEFTLTRAFEWSPDGEDIAYLRFDESHVKEFTLEYYKNETYPEPYTFKYPKVGEENSNLTVWNYSLKKKKSVQLDIGEREDDYLPRMKWTGTPDELCIIWMNRDQNHLKLIVNNVSTNKHRILLEEKNKYYIELHDNLQFLTNGNFIWTSEQSGYNQIYLYEATGRLIKGLTEGNEELTEIYGMDDVQQNLLFQKSVNRGLDRAIYKLNLESKQITPIAINPGYNSAQVSPGLKYIILTHSEINKPPVYSLNNQEGKLIRVLESNEALSEKLKSYKLSNVEISSVFNRHGDMLNALFIKPVDFNPAKKYPVFMFLYGGPGSQEVMNRWNSFGQYYWLQMLAQKDYIICVVDNRGTGGRGEEFKKSTYMQLGKLETEDQIDAAKHLSELPYVDGSRIGIFGWSYGGYMSSLCILKGNDVFKSAIAVAPVTNWKWYDSIYTERYMKRLKDNAKGYDENSPVNFADRLKGNYLLVHGMADDNVHFQNTAEMANALIKNKKQFDTYFYPNRNHGIGGQNARIHLYTKMTSFVLEKI